MRSVPLEELIKPDSYPIRGLLGRLLQDKTTRKNILFASDSYASCGAGYKDNSQMTEGVLLGFDSCDIQPRVYKAASEQTKRTRKRAEVFTPAWIVNQMNNHCDAEWFGRPDVFNRQNGQEWKVASEPIVFPKGKDWKQYVDSRRLEITCGEAPYIVSRYDASTGELIPIERRIGILDRKLRIVNKNAANETEWFKWVFRAFQSVYGYEYQGDNLLIARINLLYTLADYVEAMWNRQATKKELDKFLNVICWNFWQMDGLNDTPPYGIPHDEAVQLSMLDVDEPADDKIVYCKIYDWRADASGLFKDLKKRGKGMKFDYVIGNPPYQETTEGTSDKPIYDIFMSAAFDVSDKVCLITPARFLFNAGKTPKAWNEKMLKDKHFKVLLYEQDSSKVFNNTDIKGGVVVTYRDTTQVYGAIDVFTPHLILSKLSNRLSALLQKSNLSHIIHTQNRFNLENLFEDHPEYKSCIGSDGKDKRFRNNTFDKVPVFFKEAKTDDDVKVIGVIKNKRNWRYINKRYVDIESENLYKYKVIVPRANGTGVLGEVLSSPIVLAPAERACQYAVGAACYRRGARGS